ncbi:hypothetical protein JCM8097_008436 [Rhodosporidiobolus ruineniae]
MSSLIRTYLCCCLPSTHPDDLDIHDEHQPLLNPDILPQAPPRPSTQRTTEEQRHEQETLRRIFNLASERLISISTPSFLFSQPSHASSSSPALPSPSPSSPHSASASSSLSRSSSPTLRSSSPRPSRREGSTKKRSKKTRPAGDPDAPLAPVRARVVRLNSAWEVVNPHGDAQGDGAEGADGSIGPSPLGASDASDGDDGEGGEAGDEDADESRFDSLASYRTARSARSRSGEASSATYAAYETVRSGYPTLRGLFAVDGEDGREEVDEEELSRALAALESSIDTYTLPSFAPYVTELGGGGDENGFTAIAPADLKKSIAIMQIRQLVFYSVVGAVLYSCGGQYAPSSSRLSSSSSFSGGRVPAFAIALGTLSFPSNFAKLGMAGGLVANTGFVLISWLSAYLMVEFKLKYPYVMNVADCGEVMFDEWGARVFGVGIVAKSIGLASSDILAGKLAIATLDSYANCTIIWAAVIAIASDILSYQRHCA